MVGQLTADVSYSRLRYVRCPGTPRGWAQREQLRGWTDQHGDPGGEETSTQRHEQDQALQELEADIFAASAKASVASRQRTVAKILAEWGLRPMPPHA